MTRAFSATLRRLIRADMARRPRTGRVVAGLAGMDHTVLSRWLAGGEMQTRNVDLLVDYIGADVLGAALVAP